MKFIIPDEWMKRWSQIEAKEDGATAPVNPQLMAEYAQRAASKRAAMTDESREGDV